MLKDGDDTVSRDNIFFGFPHNPAVAIIPTLLNVLWFIHHHIGNIMK